MPDDFDALAACPLFEGVSRPDLQAMLQCMQARTVEVGKGEAVFREDAPAEHVGILLCGGALVLRDKPFEKTVTQKIKRYA